MRTRASLRRAGFTAGIVAKRLTPVLRAARTMVLTLSACGLATAAAWLLAPAAGLAVAAASCLWVEYLSGGERQ